MEGTKEIQTISKIVNHLQNLQYIQPQLLNSLSLSKEQDLSCYIGLINLLYNLALQYHKKGKQNVQHSPKENIYSDCSPGNILHLRGEILKEYGKFFMKLFHQPAYSFAKFDYQSFNSFCDARGLSDLIRSSRGIYPVIDPTKKKPLHFLSNYISSKEQRRLIGNKNWQLSKKIVKKIYNDQIKKNNVNQQQDKNIFNISEYLKLNKQDKNGNQIVKKDLSLQKGIKMFYILLTESYEQFDQLIKLFQKQCVSNQEVPVQNQQINQQLLDRLKFWFQNYKSFVQDGLQFYLSKAQPSNLQILSHFKPNKFEDIIIQAIEKLFYQITNSNSNTFAEQTKTDLEIKINQFNAAVQDGLLIPQTSYYLLDYDQNLDYKDSNRMLMLSYIYVIHKLLFPQDQEKNLSKKIYMSIKTNQNPIQQPFNRVFYSDDELLSLYEKGQLKELPTKFQYSPEISIKILKLLINKNPYNLFDYLENITILKPYQRLQILINSKLIGDVRKINVFANDCYIIGSQYETEGQHLLSIIAESTNQYKSLIRNPNQKIDAYKNFIDEWRQFYHFYRNFNENYLQQFLLKFKASQALKSQVEIQESRNYFIPSDFILPHQRKDSFYHVIEKFILVFKQEMEKFTQMLQEMDPNQRKNDILFKNYVDMLTTFVKIIMKSEFKQILSQAKPNHSINQNQLKMESQGNEQKQLFEDRVWKIYAEAYLILNQFSKKLLINSEKQQKKAPTPVFTKAYPGQGQKMIFNAWGNQKHYIHEIDDDDDDDD